MSTEYTPLAQRESEGAAPATPPGAPSRGSRYAVIAIGAAVIGCMAVLANRSTGPDAALLAEMEAPKLSSSMTDIQSQKIRYSDKSEAEIEEIFEDFIMEFKKPYSTDQDAKATRYMQFKTNLHSIDMFNERNPFAVFKITDRADWTDEERNKMRGVKSATLAAKPGETRSSYEILKAAYPDQSVIAMGERGANAVAEEASKRKAMLAKVQQKDEILGDEMSEAMFPWITAEDCAACKMYPHFADYDWSNVPTDFDWRALGAVSSVLNQKYCGSCWTFSTAQDVEGTHFLATGELWPLSEQQLVACDVDNDGCDGGWPFRAMQYVHKIGGMLRSTDYPYKGICAWDACDENAGGQDDPTPTCDTALLINETESGNVAAIGGYQMVAMGEDYEGLARVALVKNGPLSMAFNANGMDYYSHGIVGCNATANDGDINAGCIQHGAGEDDWSCDPTAIDHAVLIVAYGVQDDLPYWVIKNSWSDAWGEDGYYRIMRGQNECGVMNFVTHSVVKDAHAAGLDTQNSGSNGQPSSTDDQQPVNGGGSKTSGGHSHPGLVQ